MIVFGKISPHLVLCWLRAARISQRGSVVSGYVVRSAASRQVTWVDIAAITIA